MSKQAARGGSNRDKRGERGSRDRKRGGEAPRLDAANLAGLTSLMNLQNVNPSADLDSAEKAVMRTSQGKAKVSETDPVKLYNDELAKLADDLGIDLLDDPSGGARSTNNAAAGLTTAPSGAAASSANALPDRPKTPFAPVKGTYTRAGIDSLIDDIGLGGDDRDDGHNNRHRGSNGVDRNSSRDDHHDRRDRGDYHDRHGRREGRDRDDHDSHNRGHEERPRGHRGSDESEESESESDDRSEDDSEDDSDSRSESSSGSEDSDEGDDPDGEDGDDRHHEHKGRGDEIIDAEVDDVISKLEGDLGIRTDSRDKKRHKMKPVSVPQSDRSSHRHQSLTEEQERRTHINSVLRDMRKETRTTFGTEKERIQDIKANKLEQIGQLRMTLEEEGIDTKSVGNPTPDSPMDEVDSVLNILRLKNDRNRYSSLAEEVVLGLAEGVETVFDGTRKIPVLGWKPDYTGYHATVNCKLHRMRFETSQIVGNIIEKYNVGPMGRIILELLPSFFLYPRQVKKQKGTPGLHNDPHVADARGAYQAIRESDERRDLDTVANL